MRQTIVMFMIGCAIPIIVAGCGGGDASSTGGDAVAQNQGGTDAGMPPGGADAPGDAGGMPMGPEGGQAGAGYDMNNGGPPGDPGGAGAGFEPPPGQEGYPGGDPADPAAAGAGYAPPGQEGYPGGDPAAPGYAPPGQEGYPGGPPGNPGAAGAGFEPPPGQPGFPGGDPADPAAPGGYVPPGQAGYPGGPPGAPGAPGGAPGAPGYGAPGEFGPGQPGGEGVPGDYGPAGGGARAARPTGFDGAAQVAFQTGHEADAFKYLYAHALSSAEGGANLLTSIQWVNGLKRPALGVRFGAGVAFKGPANITDVKPIGSTQALPERGQRGDDFGGGAPGGLPGPKGAAGLGGPLGGFPGGGGDGDGGGQGGGLIAKFAGDLGRGLIREFETRVNKGAFGAVLKDAPKSGGRGGDFQGDGAGGYGPPGIGGPPGAPGDPGGAPGVGAGLGAPPGPGGFAPPGGFGGGEDGHDTGIGVARGLTVLGVGTERELLDKARKDGVDVLALFEVAVKVNPKTALITNDTKMVLIDVAKGARLHTGKLMNNFKVQKARADSKDDGVAKEIESLFEFIDANLIMSPIPSALTSEHIAKRVASLVASKPDDMLPVLTEIRFWNRKSLLDDDGLTAAFSAMLSPEIGAQLATGTEDERKEIVKRWLPAGDG